MCKWSIVGGAGVASLSIMIDINNLLSLYKERHVLCIMNGRNTNK
jgi:hypothetical protein